MSLASLTCLVRETQSSAKGHLSHTRDHTPSAAPPALGAPRRGRGFGLSGVFGGHCPGRSSRSVMRTGLREGDRSAGGEVGRWPASSFPGVGVGLGRGATRSSTNPFVLVEV